MDRNVNFHTQYCQYAMLARSAESMPILWIFIQLCKGRIYSRHANFQTDTDGTQHIFVNLEQGIFVLRIAHKWKCVSRTFFKETSKKKGK